MKVAQYKWLILICLAVGLVFVVALSVAKGSGELSVLSVLQTFVGGGTPQEQTIVFSLRLPRILTAMLAGSALAVSGAVLQGIVRNPLASPDIIGMTGGAALFAVFFITFLSGTVSYHWLPLFALGGAAFTSALIYMLAWNKGVTPIRIVLIGVGLSALAGSLTIFMIVLSPSYNASQAYVWLRGSVYGSSWEDVYMLLPWLVVFFPLAWLMARVINVHEFGEEVAAGLGSAVQRHRIALLGISIALAGAAVSVVGAIGFVGLIAPHLARKLTGRSYRWLIPSAAVIGALLVVGADLLARTSFPPYDIPAGVFTAGIGAPFFIYLLFRSK